MNDVKLVWATPDADAVIARIARVSNPANQDNPEIVRLLRYMMRHGHVSPFEMASACIEITTTRDIARQILRHRSFSFQEFSQRYAAVDALPDPEPREARMQDTQNRQNSLPCTDRGLSRWWGDQQRKLLREADSLYSMALAQGIAKEVARAVLPEGLTVSRMYMSGTLRSWVHYLTQRLDPSTQAEHRAVAVAVLDTLRTVAPVVMTAFFGELE